MALRYLRTGFDALNTYLEQCVGEDDARRVGERTLSIGEAWTEEAARASIPQLRPLPAEPLDSAEVMTGRVDAKARVRVSTNHYSVPVGLSGRRVEVRLQARHVTMLHGGQVVAGHERLQGSHGEALQLDHYLDLLKHILR